ncbi:MAG: TlpA family protein disulfide reductase, partial [Planctomycetaceae bacterium]
MPLDRSAVSGLTFIVGTAALFLTLALPGCGDGGDTASTDGGSAVEEEPQSTWDGELTIEIRDWEGVQQMVAERKGKVVVLDVWTIWCEPCVEEFPAFVDLQHKYGEEVACIGVNTAYTGLDEDFKNEVEPSYLEPKVREFLEEQGADFPNVICSVPDEQLYEKIGTVVPSVF